MTDEELIELTNNIIDCINADGKLPIHSSAVLMNMVLRLKSRPESKWISVDESLPEENTYVMVANSYGAHCLAHQYNKFGWWPYGYNLLTQGITHWQPLPSPPTTKGAQG